MKKNTAVIVLAAGLSTRMAAKTSKVILKVGQKTIVERTCASLEVFSPGQIIIIVNKSNSAQIAKATSNKYSYPIQQKALGTADAVKIGLKALKKEITNVGILYGDDNIFLRPQTFEKVYMRHIKEVADITFLTLNKKNPHGLGRVFRKMGKVLKIVEEKDASKSERKIKEVNNGLYFFKKSWLEKNIVKLAPSKTTGEIYITDTIELAAAQGKKVEAYQMDGEDQFFTITTADDLKRANDLFKKRIHIMGINGSGASAVAQIAKASGFIVDGCDLQLETAYSERKNSGFQVGDEANLERRSENHGLQAVGIYSTKGIDILKGHDPSHLANISQLVVSPAVLKYDLKNPEIAQAKKINIKISTWQKFQAQRLQKNKFVVAVAGAFGKSTTTAMVSQILIDAKLDPICEVGAKVVGWGKNYNLGKSKYYVCEADEYNNNFLNYKPDIAVVLNLEWDHPDFFKNKNEVKTAYLKFINNIKSKGTLITTQEVIKETGKSIRPDVKVTVIKNTDNVKLSIIGKFREQNAQAAMAVAQTLGISTKLAKKSLENFKGVARRLEFKGEIKGVKFYDDYAVQPYTIKETANALKEKYPGKKLTLVLEPHTFSRIKAFFGDFVKSLKETTVDEILVTSVYAAREKGDKDSLAKSLAKSVGKKAKFSGSIEKTAEIIGNNLQNLEVVLSMGAGNNYKLYGLVKK